MSEQQGALSRVGGATATSEKRIRWRCFHFASRSRAEMGRKQSAFPLTKRGARNSNSLEELARRHHGHVAEQGDALAPREAEQVATHFPESSRVESNAISPAPRSMRVEGGWPPRGKVEVKEDELGERSTA